MTIDFIIPVRRVHTVERLLWSLSRNSRHPDSVSLISNDLVAESLHTFGLNVRLVRFSSEHYPFGELDVALRRNVGIWSSEASHIVTFDDDQLAPPNLVSSSEQVFQEKPFFWGHHRFFDFNACTFEQILSLPPEAGRTRETPPNGWHSWRSAYAGLFGARRDLLLEVGGFDMIFAGRHGGEDQHLGQRLAAKFEFPGAIFVHEPPFAWHPESNTRWTEPQVSNQCHGAHDLKAARVGNVTAQLCRRCPFYYVPDEELLQPYASIRFDPAKVEIRIEQAPGTESQSLFDRFISSKMKVSVVAARKRLAKAYEEYTSDVSPPDFAVSLETAGFLYALCKNLTPTYILDLGSGFSSYALRLYAANHPGAQILTVDDDASWLRKTAHFLRERNLPTDRLMTWSEFLQQSAHPANMIFHDLGSMATRQSTLPAVLNYCRIGGVVILDDMHKEEYAPYAEQILIGGKFHAVDISEYTLDRFGRFSWMATKGA